MALVKDTLMSAVDALKLFSLQVHYIDIRNAAHV